MNYVVAVTKNDLLAVGFGGAIISLKNGGGLGIILNLL
jgi:hypothetical protein